MTADDSCLDKYREKPALRATTLLRDCITSLSNDIKPFYGVLWLVAAALSQAHSDSLYTTKKAKYGKNECCFSPPFCAVRLYWAENNLG